jgi:hypothetical protein
VIWPVPQPDSRPAMAAAANSVPPRTNVDMRVTFPGSSLGRATA